jgi:hypothetical protein
MGYMRFLALGAGVMDFLTGLGLVFFPSLTLRLMMVPVPEDPSLIFVRFVGVFVGAVGAIYLVAWFRRDPADLVAVFRLTLPFRFGAGTFCAVSVAIGDLAPMWLSVSATDLGLVIVQVVLVRRLNEAGG